MEKSMGSQNEAKESHILGVDFGESKIGMAIADEETKMAFAFDTFKNDKEFLKNLLEIVDRENVETIVIGMTEHEKDSESKRKKEAFGKMLEEKLDVEIAYHEEMFTTKMAQANLKTHGGKNIAGKDDQEAARIILQSWLDEDFEKRQRFERSKDALSHTRNS